MTAATIFSVKRRRYSAGAASAIKLTAMTGPNGLRANGEDIAMVDVEVVDSQEPALSDGRSAD